MNSFNKKVTKVTFHLNSEIISKNIFIPTVKWIIRSPIRRLYGRQIASTDLYLI